MRRLFAAGRPAKLGGDARHHRHLELVHVHLHLVGPHAGHAAPLVEERHAAGPRPVDRGRPVAHILLPVRKAVQRLRRGVLVRVDAAAHLIGISARPVAPVHAELAVGSVAPVAPPRPRPRAHRDLGSNRLGQRRRARPRPGRPVVAAAAAMALVAWTLLADHGCGTGGGGRVCGGRGGGCGRGRGRGSGRGGGGSGIDGGRVGRNVVAGLGGRSRGRVARSRRSGGRGHRLLSRRR